MEAQPPVDIDPQVAAGITDRLWQEAMDHFSFTGNELLLQVSAVATIGMLNVERLKTQLSSFLGRPCVAFVDNDLGCVRILARPEYNGVDEASQHILGSEIQTGQAGLSEDHDENHDGNSDKQIENKTKAPRPPNAFILYRKYYHAILKERNPAIQNNEISVAVGTQWHKEPAEVKAHFKAMADEAKREHAAKYPGYQYAPRKPSQKKRRNTRRRNRAGQNDYDTPSGDDEEESPQTPGTVNIFATSDEEEIDHDINELLPFVTYPAPVESYEATDFEMGEYDQWVTEATQAQNDFIVSLAQAQTPYQIPMQRV